MRISSIRVSSYLFIFLTFFINCNDLFPQQRAADKDSLLQFTSETAVITADRYLNKVSSSTASVSYINSGDISALPVISPAEILNYLPGFTVVSPDGSGKKSALTVRGFYGGGEAEYVLVMLNGQKINDQETGIADFNLIPLQAIESIEIVRGSNSPLYGDAAMGGVINLRTAQKPGFHRIFIEGGSFSRLNAGINSAGRLGAIPYTLFAANERTKGFRDHSKWQGSILGGSLSFPFNANAGLKLSTLNRWNNSDEPGPVLQQEVSPNREFSHSYYKYDSQKEERYQTQLEFELNNNENTILNSSVLFRHKEAGIVRSFTNLSYILGPDYSIAGVYDTSLYGDTKKRGINENLLSLNLLYTFMPRNSPFGAVTGAEFESGWIRSSYSKYFSGFDVDYRLSDVSSGDLLTEGRNKRSKYALFINSEIRLLSSLKLSFGIRYDRIQDKYNGEIPDTSLSSVNSAVSPKAGINFLFNSGEKYTANAYFSFNRSFKAPTVDQLTDQRPGEIMFFIPAGGSSYIQNAAAISPYSNPELKPQRASSFDLGTYQRYRFNDKTAAELMLSLYLTDLRDEIDFDLSSMKYRNILSSRHSGVESGLRITIENYILLFANYNYTSVKFRDGVLKNNSLKGIPENTFSAGMAFKSKSGLSFSLTWAYSGESYLDDDNTAMLPSFGRLGAGVSWHFNFVKVYVSSDNILDKKFSSSGYIYSGKTFLFPASGRKINAGLMLEL